MNNDKRIPNTKDSIFTDPHIQAAKQALSPEERARFQKLGDGLYGSINFETGDIAGTENDATLYILKALQSGLHPSELDEDEKFFLSDKLGETWWIELGYKGEDLATCEANFVQQHE